MTDNGYPYNVQPGKHMLVCSRVKYVRPSDCLIAAHARLGPAPKKKPVAKEVPAAP